MTEDADWSSGRADGGDVGVLCNASGLVLRAKRGLTGRAGAAAGRVSGLMSEWLCGVVEWGRGRTGWWRVPPDSSVPLNARRTAICIWKGKKHVCVCVRARKAKAKFSSPGRKRNKLRKSHVYSQNNERSAARLYRGSQTRVRGPPVGPRGGLGVGSLEK